MLSIVFLFSAAMISMVNFLSESMSYSSLPLNLYLSIQILFKETLNTHIELFENTTKIPLLENLVYSF